MNTKNLRALILENNREDIEKYIDKFGKPDDWRVYRDMARLAIKRTRAGRDPNAVRALMDSGYTFVGIDGWTRHNEPICALMDLLWFSWKAQSRKQEAVNLLRDVFEYEARRGEHIPGKIIPITHPEMAKAKKLVELELRHYRKILTAKRGGPTLVLN